MLDVSRHLKDRDVHKLLKDLGINEDYTKIRIDFLSTKREEYLKKLIEEKLKIEKTYVNAERIMAMDKQRREGKT